MKSRSVAMAAISAVLAIGATASAQENPFDSVFALMTQDRSPDSPGCRGCHIVEDPSMAFGPYFGNTQDEVEYELINGEGMYVAGGRDSMLANFLRDGSMPLDGRMWADKELELLYIWLDTVTAGSTANAGYATK